MAVASSCGFESWSGGTRVGLEIPGLEQTKPLLDRSVQVCETDAVKVSLKVAAPTDAASVVPEVQQAGDPL